MDAGHGGEDEGARGAGGTKEKDLTLAVARRLKSAIETRLGIRVLLTRDEDRNIPVDDRAAMANNNKADLFISLHAGASLRPRASGAAIFYAAFDKDAEEQARASLGTERVPTFSGGQRDIELLLWDVAQIRHLTVGGARQILERELHDRIPLSAPIERAPWGPGSANMPAVIVEMATSRTRTRRSSSPATTSEHARAGARRRRRGDSAAIWRRSHDVRPHPRGRQPAIAAGRPRGSCSPPAPVRRAGGHACRGGPSISAAAAR